MPHQTRSRGTPSSKEEEQQQLQGGDEPSSAPNATSHADDEGGSSRSSGARLPLEQGTQPQDYHPSSSSSSAATPARKREGGPSASSSSASRSRASARSPWGGGGGERRDPHGAARGSSAAGAMFSPPHYKTHPYPHSSDRHPHAPPPASTPGAASTTPNMDHHLHHSHVGAGRDFDQLDLNVDFTGPEDPLMLGSFGEEESPPRLPPGGRSPSVERERDSERKRSSSSAISRLRRTPPPPPSQPTNPYAYQQSYRRSPRDTYDRSSGSSQHGGPPPPPPPHGYPYSGYAPLPPHASSAPGYGGAPSRLSPKHYPGYPPYPYHPEHYWDAPSGGHPYPAMYDHDDDIPPPPPSSTKKRPPSSTAAAAAAAASVPLTASPEGTPEKPINTRSPFRSPPTSRKFKRSPDFHASPHFGTYGSFGLDTPNAMLGPAEFSPMGPSLQEFDENAPLPLGISRSNSQDSATPVIRRPKEESSPLTGFMNVLSPFESLHGGIARSPVVYPPLHGYDDPPSSSRHLGRGPKPVTASGARGSGGEPRMHSTPHGSVKKALWPRSEGPPSSTPGRLRVEIGSTGALSTRKSLEGINSMMHSRHSSGRESSSSTTTPSRHESRYASSSHHHYRGPPVSHPGGYRGDLTTPIKSSYHSLHHTPSSMHRPYPASSASKYGHHGPPLLSHHKDYPGSGSKARYGPPSSSIPSSAGKENNKKQPPQAVTPKRSPCNCKKSKCLKLYCECFAAELFCQDCNCSDCGNTPTAGAIRDKAIKDTRAKNPNAFKPRFSAKTVPQAAAASPATGHNMGCRCKKSECLKKYCECFQAGAICGAKCKCVDCLNFAGSQALIDKRRKIKDQRGADFAMRVADEAWRQGQPGGPPRRPAAPAAAAAAGGPPPPSSASRHPPSKSSIATPRGHMPPPPHMMHPSPRGGPPPPYEGAHGHPHHYHAYHSMPPQYMRGPPPPHGYAPMGMPMTPAGYPHHNYAESPHGMYPPHLGPPPPSSTQRKDLKRPPPSSAPPPTHVTPMAATPRTPGIRVQFDPASSRKKRKISIGQEEATIPFFGMKFPAQPKTTALAVFAFLSNDDLYNAGLVCKSWSQLAMDGELWKFET